MLSIIRCKWLSIKQLMFCTYSIGSWMNLLSLHDLLILYQEVTVLCTIEHSLDLYRKMNRTNDEYMRLKHLLVTRLSGRFKLCLIFECVFPFIIEYSIYDTIEIQKSTQIIFNLPCNSTIVSIHMEPSHWKISRHLCECQVLDDHSS